MRMATSLSMQLEEVEYELRMREAVYPRLVTRKTLRESEAKFHIERMEAVAKTLRWLIVNQDEIKKAMQPELKTEPEVTHGVV
jgi:hypothetical protein